MLINWGGCVQYRSALNSWAAWKTERTSPTVTQSAVATVCTAHRVMCPARTTCSPSRTCCRDPSSLDRPHRQRRRSKRAVFAQPKNTYMCTKRHKQWWWIQQLIDWGLTALSVQKGYIVYLQVLVQSKAWYQWDSFKSITFCECINTSVRESWELVWNIVSYCVHIWCK